jgi:hypothetical protein
LSVQRENSNRTLHLSPSKGSPTAKTMEASLLSGVDVIQGRAGLTTGAFTFELPSTSVATPRHRNGNLSQLAIVKSAKRNWLFGRFV